MMELKFRAWDTKEKSMIMNPLNFPELYPTNELMQYTGMKDKNDKEIYEGDIVECFSPYGGVFKAKVVFVDGCFEINEPKGKDGVFRDYLKCLTCNHAVKVIGNIYESPELLTVASDRKYAHAPGTLRGGGCGALFFLNGYQNV